MAKIAAVSSAHRYMNERLGDNCVRIIFILDLQRNWMRCKEVEMGSV